MSIFEKCRYPHSTILYKLEKIETDLKKLNSSPARKEELERYAKKANKQLDHFRLQLKGMNLWFFAFGVIAVHSTLLVTRKTLLYELPFKQYLMHLGLLAGAGILTGTLVGNVYAKDLKTYRKVNRLQNELNGLRKK
jgi:hypothetical protein